MHTNLDAAEGGVNEVLAGHFRDAKLGDLCRAAAVVWASIDPITVPQLAKKAQQELAKRCNLPTRGSGCSGEVHRQRDDRCGGWPSSAARAAACSRMPSRMGADCLLTGEANHHHAMRRSAAGAFRSSRQGHYATEFPVTAAVAEKLRGCIPGGGGAGQHQKPGPLYLYCIMSRKRLTR